MSLPGAFPSTAAARALEQPLLPWPGSWPWHARYPEDRLQGCLSDTFHQHTKVLLGEKPLCPHIAGAAPSQAVQPTDQDLMRPKRDCVELNSKRVAASPSREPLTCWNQRPLSLAHSQALSAKNPDAEAHASTNQRSLNHPSGFLGNQDLDSSEFLLDLL